jgi:crotonobetainyl-CoA:carnitine CoA-transferase CaiB-like acyl-CoA transferase
MTFERISEALEAGNIPFAGVSTPLTLMEDRHLKESDHWIEVEGAGQQVRIPKMPLDFASVDFRLTRQPPALGEHTDEVLHELGYDANEIEEMKIARTVLKSSQMLNTDRKR